VEGRGRLGGERAEQLGKLRKRNHCARKTPFFKKEPPRALGKSSWRTPSARTTQSLTEGLGTTSHVAEALASMRRRGKTPRSLPRRLGATAGGYSQHRRGQQSTPRMRGTTEPPCVGATRRLTVKTGTAVGVANSELTTCARWDSTARTKKMPRSRYDYAGYRFWPHLQARTLP
jgi:hypothetical protein